MDLLSKVAATESTRAAFALTPLNRRVLLICGGCGPATVAVALMGWLIAGVLPLPLGPGSGIEQVVSFYSAGVHVALGLAISSIGVGLAIPLIAGVTWMMWRSEAGAPLLTLVQLISGAVTAVCLLLPLLIMAVAGFRPERDPALTVMLNDLAWLMFITPIAPFIIQNLAIATLVLASPERLLPRWLGFMNLWVGFTFSFDPLAFAFTTGPFAWNGLLIFWLALTTYSIWLLAMGLFLCSLALRRPESESKENAP